MRTAKEMVQYCKDNKVDGKYLWGFQKRRLFVPIEEYLREDETIIGCFIARHENEDSSEYYAHAVTDQRLMVSSKTIGGQSITSIKKDNVSDVSKETKMFTGTIVIDTYKETIVFSLRKKAIQRIYRLMIDNLI